MTDFTHLLQLQVPNRLVKKGSRRQQKVASVARRSGDFLQLKGPFYFICQYEKTLAISAVLRSVSEIYKVTFLETIFTAFLLASNFFIGDCIKIKDR